MNLAFIVATVGAGWFALAVILALGFGRMIRIADDENRAGRDYWTD